MMGNFDDVALDAFFASMIARDPDDFFQSFVINVSSKEDLSVDSVSREGPVKNKAVFISVHQIGIIEPGSEWAMDEELDAVRGLIPVGNQVAGVSNQVRARFQRKTFTLQPAPE